MRFKHATWPVRGCLSANSFIDYGPLKTNEQANLQNTHVRRIGAMVQWCASFTKIGVIVI